MTTRRDPTVGSPTTPWKALLGAVVPAPLTLDPGYLILAKTDNALEGGQIDFEGGGNGGFPFGTWTLDSWTGQMRWFFASIVKWTLDSAGNMGVSGKVSTNTASIGDVGHGSLWGGFAHNAAFSTVAYALLQNSASTVTRLNVATGGQVSLAINNADQWIMELTGHLVPAFNNTRDFGKAALRLRDIYIQGETIAQNGDNCNTANQATFINVATNVQGAGWESGGAGEVWTFDIFIPYLPSSTGGVQFAFQGPITTIAFTGTGPTTGPTVFSTEFLVTVGTFTTLRGTFNGSAYLHLVGNLTTSGAGSITVQGKTGINTTNCQIRRGLVQTCRRVA